MGSNMDDSNEPEEKADVLPTTELEGGTESRDDGGESNITGAQLASLKDMVQELLEYREEE